MSAASSSTARHTRRRVVIIGGGFGGLYAAKSLGRSPFGVTLIDRRNFHLFQPLLYQVATGGLSPANIAAPLRAVLKRCRNVRIILGEVTGFDVERREVILRQRRAAYDALIVAAGTANHYFGKDHWAAHAPGLKSIEDATEIRRRILLAFEQAELESNPEQRRAWLTFTVIGGGLTGVELAGTLAEIARYTLRREFRTINPAEARILLLEGAGRVLQTYPPDLAAKGHRALQRLGVTIRTNALVTDIDADGVRVKTGDCEERIETRTVLWSAGVRAAPLGKILAEATGAELDKIGRVIVNSDCTLPGQSNIFVIGDLAHCRGPNGAPLPGVAPVAMQQGAYVARLLQRRLRGLPTPPFRYRDRGMMATIGRAAAVADLGRLRFNGYAAWLVWLFVHLFFLIQFQNRILVMIQWAWNYFTWSRPSRLIINYRDEPRTDQP
jgi:NADH dehydrogenase